MATSLTSSRGATRSGTPWTTPPPTTTGVFPLTMGTIPAAFVARLHHVCCSVLLSSWPSRVVITIAPAQSWFAWKIASTLCLVCCSAQQLLFCTAVFVICSLSTASDPEIEIRVQELVDELLKPAFLIRAEVAGGVAMLRGGARITSLHGQKHPLIGFLTCF